MEVTVSYLALNFLGEQLHLEALRAEIPLSFFLQRGGIGQMGGH